MKPRKNDQWSGETPKISFKKLPAKLFSEENQKEKKAKNTCHGICPLVALEQPIQKPVEERAGTISLMRAKILLEIGSKTS